LIDENLAAVLEPAKHPRNATLGDDLSLAEAFGLDLRLGRGQRRRPVIGDICSSIEHVVCRGSDRPLRPAREGAAAATKRYYYRTSAIPVSGQLW
jgi:hypothetical protein